MISLLSDRLIGRLFGCFVGWLVGWLFNRSIALGFLRFQTLYCSYNLFRGRIWSVGEICQVMPGKDTEGIQCPPCYYAVFLSFVGSTDYPDQRLDP